MTEELIHATAVAREGVALLLRGPPGSGKSDLALRLIDQGWQLVSDDQTALSVEKEGLVARAPQAIAGKLEVHGLGVQDAPVLAAAPVALVVDLVAAEAVERLPEETLAELLGQAVPVIAVNPFEISMAIKLRLALARAAGKTDGAPLQEAAETAVANPPGDNSPLKQQRSESPAANSLQVVLVTGLSGAGRSTALKALEDVGYEAIDNLPLSFLESIVSDGGLTRPIAVGVDIRTRDFAAGPVMDRLDRLSQNPRLSTTLLFLDADNEVLRRRFTETRRRHPLAEDRPVTDGIVAERNLLVPLRNAADLMVDTSSLTPNALRQVLEGHLGLAGSPQMVTFVVSFSYRIGLPREADLVFDTRFLTNPHYEPALKAKSGRDDAVVRFIEGDAAFAPFYGQLTALLGPLLPRYEASGKSYLTIAVGCTGGRHRSVAVAEKLAEWLRSQGRPVTLNHRDLEDEPNAG